MVAGNEHDGELRVDSRTTVRRDARARGPISGSLKKSGWLPCRRSPIDNKRKEFRNSNTGDNSIVLYGSFIV